jgi:hypothetical protein
MPSRPSLLQRNVGPHRIAHGEMSELYRPLIVSYADSTDSDKPKYSYVVATRGRIVFRQIEQTPDYRDA